MLAYFRTFWIYVGLNIIFIGVYLLILAMEMMGYWGADYSAQVFPAVILVSLVGTIPNLITMKVSWHYSEEPIPYIVWGFLFVVGTFLVYFFTYRYYLSLTIMN